MRIENVTPIFPHCPTCGKEMRLTGHAPTCESVIYDFLCTDDGDRLSWRPRRVAALPPFRGTHSNIGDFPPPQAELTRGAKSGLGRR